MSIWYRSPHITFTYASSSNILWYSDEFVMLERSKSEIEKLNQIYACQCHTVQIWKTRICLRENLEIQVVLLSTPAWAMDHELSHGYVMMIDGSVQHTRIAATPYVYVWMECVCMATDTHQLWIYLWILTGHRASLSRGFAHLYSTEQHAARNHDSSHYRKCKGGSQLQPLWVGPYGHNTGKLMFLSWVFQAPWWSCYDPLPILSKELECDMVENLQK
jgi:hypothetical protein